MKKQFANSPGLPSKKDAASLLWSAGHGKRVVALTTDDTHFFGQLVFTDKTAIWSDDGWLPASLVMCPRELAVREEMDDAVLDAAIDAALGDSSTRFVEARVGLAMNDNYEMRGVLSFPLLMGPAHGIPGWVSDETTEALWHLGRDKPITLHLLRVQHKLQGILTRTRATIDRLNQEGALHPVVRDIVLHLERGCDSISHATNGKDE